MAPPCLFRIPFSALASLEVICRKLVLVTREIDRCKILGQNKVRFILSYTTASIAELYGVRSNVVPKG